MTSRTLSQRVADDLRGKIADGQLKVGDPIPSQSRLTTQYDVSTSVTRKAVDQLRNEGLLTGQPGKAVYVQATPTERADEGQHLEQMAARIDSLETQVASLSEGADVAPNLAPIDEIHAEVAQLTRQVATLRAHLIDLYGRVGQPYPQGETEEPARADRNIAGGMG